MIFMKDIAMTKQTQRNLWWYGLMALAVTFCGLVTVGYLGDRWFHDDYADDIEMPTPRLSTAGSIWVGQDIKH
jgi:hypothetical protein